MMVDWAEVSSLGTWAGIGLAVGGALIGFGKLHMRAEDAHRLATEAKQQGEENSADLAAFKTESAEKFVSNSVIEKFEVKVFDAIEKMGGRIDAGLGRLADRLDRIFETRKP